MTHSLEKLIIKPPYLSISKGNIVNGSFGHGTFIFKRPIIEGYFYLEFIIKNDTTNQKKTAYKSAVRVGICPIDFNPSFPLGSG